MTKNFLIKLKIFTNLFVSSLEEPARLAASFITKRDHLFSSKMRVLRDFQPEVIPKTPKFRIFGDIFFMKRISYIY